MRRPVNSMRRPLILMRPLLIGLFLFAGLCPLTLASSEVELTDVEIPADMDSIKQGAQLALSICNSCHNLRYIEYTNLKTLNFSKEEIDAWRGSNPMNTGLMSRTPDDAMETTFGLVPPDLSTIAKARRGGGRYVYTLLSSFALDEKGNLVNHLFPGIRMPDVLGWTEAANDKERDEIRAHLLNIAAFLQWASDPNAAKRKTMGFYVIIYLVIITFLLWLINRRMWAGVKKFTLG